MVRVAPHQFFILRSMYYEQVIEQEVYDNSEYSIAGDVVDHRNGTVTVKMGKPTAEELLAIMDLALLDATYENLMGGNK